jgi:ketosteroid isomerase-like protein
VLRASSARSARYAAVVTRRTLVIAVAAAVVVAVGVWLAFFRDGDEAKIRAAIVRATEAVRTTEDDTNPLMRLARVKTAFKESLDKEVRVHVEEVAGVPASLSGLDGVAGAVAQGLGIFESASTAAGDIEIKLGDGQVSAQATAKVVFTGTERGGRLRVERRDVSYVVTKTDRGWRITSITVWAAKP